MHCKQFKDLSCVSIAGLGGYITARSCETIYRSMANKRTYLLGDFTKSKCDRQRPVNSSDKSLPIIIGKKYRRQKKPLVSKGLSCLFTWNGHV